MTEALHLILAGGDSVKIRKLLDDADFDCHRARHDAIDAASSKITADITAMVNSLGHDAVLRAYPNFPAFYQSLRKLRRKIVASRKNRESRDAIYESIENVDLPSLVSDFEDVKASEDIMRSLAKQGRRHRTLVIVLLIIEIVVIMVSVWGLIQGWLKG